jgi:hypothetical protein
MQIGRGGYRAKVFQERAAFLEGPVSLIEESRINLREADPHPSGVFVGFACSPSARVGTSAV